MNNIDKTLNALDDYFNNTPPDEIKKGIDEINAMSKNGVTFEQYIASLTPNERKAYYKGRANVIKETLLFVGNRISKSSPKTTHPKVIEKYLGAMSAYRDVVNYLNAKKDKVKYLKPKQ